MDGQDKNPKFQILLILYIHVKPISIFYFVTKSLTVKLIKAII